ncbi:MAG: toll/interleukin-1 receptor domain-containing protein [Candidatus Geothermincolia bacterium]
MVNLNFREKQLLETYLEMSGGYVLNFSEKSFAEFFRDFDIDIQDDQYLQGPSGSKANRMRSFLASAPDHLVGTVLQELVEYAESYRPGHAGLDACRALATRLQSRQSKTSTQPVDAGLTSRATHRPPSTPSPIDVFFSYAHEDEALMDQVRRQLVVHERLGSIVKLIDRMIPAGNDWRSHIDDRIKRAHVILLFMSPDFLASRYCYEVEGRIALQRHRDGTAKVIPVVLRACDWTATPFGEIQGLPRDGTPITQWPDRDQASLDVARGIMASIRGLR